MRQDFHFGVPAPDIGGVVVGTGHGYDDRAWRVGGRRGLHDGDRTATDVMAVRGLFVHDDRDVANVVVDCTADDDADVATAFASVVVVGVRRRRHLVVHRGGRQHAAAHCLGHGRAQLRRVAAVVAADRRRSDDHCPGRRVHHQVAARPKRAGPRPVTWRAAVVGGLVVVDLQRRRLVQVQFTWVAATTDVLPSYQRAGLRPVRRRRRRSDGRHVRLSVQQQQPQSVLLHGRLVGRRRSSVLELGIHHCRVGMMRTAVGRRQSGHEPPVGFGRVVQRSAQPEHRSARRRFLTGRQAPRYTADGH